MQETFWQRTRERKEDTAHFKYLGVTVSLVAEICEMARPHLARCDKSIVRRGQPTMLNHVDVCAVALRYTQLLGDTVIIGALTAPFAPAPLGGAPLSAPSFSPLPRGPRP